MIDKRIITLGLILTQILNIVGFKCPGYDIPRKFRCDAIDNCGDNSDEKDCPGGNNQPENILTLEELENVLKTLKPLITEELETNKQVECTRYIFEFTTHQLKINHLTLTFSQIKF